MGRLIRDSPRRQNMSTSWSSSDPRRDKILCLAQTGGYFVFFLLWFRLSSVFSLWDDTGNKGLIRATRGKAFFLSAADDTGITINRLLRNGRGPGPRNEMPRFPAPSSGPMAVSPRWSPSRNRFKFAFLGLWHCFALLFPCDKATVVKDLISISEDHATRGRSGRGPTDTRRFHNLAGGTSC